MYVMLHVVQDRIKPNWTNRNTHTIDKVLLSRRNDATEVGAVLSAVLLCILPGMSVSEVPVGEHRDSGYENIHISYIMQPGSFKLYRALQWVHQG